jgi:glycosyltransferase involved in cell wall biosynthesis
MKYSFIVACFNIEKYIYACLSSLSKIKFNDIEFIIVNDGSTDSSLKIIQDFCNSDIRFKLINQENKGLVSARKIGLKESIGKYILFIDGDDYIIPSTFKHINNYISLFSPDLLVFRYFKDLMGKKIKVAVDKKTFVESKTKKLFINSTHEATLSTYLWNKIFLKTKLEKLYPLINNSLTIGEDAAISFPYFKNSTRSILLNKHFYVYRQHQTSMLKTFSNESLESQNLQNLADSFKKTIPDDINYHNFIKALLIVRLGGFYSSLKDDPKFILNFLHKRKIIIFSTGNFGQKIYSNNLTYNFFSVLGFLDPDKNESSKLGFYMIDLEKLSSIKFDYVLIASLNRSYIKKSLKTLSSFIKLDKVVVIDSSAINNYPLERYLSI